MAVINKNGNFVAIPLSFKRGNPIALDTSAVWYNYEEMSTYAASSLIAYVGQILSLVDEGTNKTTAYMIMDTAGTLQEVGKATLGDGKSITLNDSTLSLKNWGVQYYKWVEGEGENPGSHVLQVVDENNPWITGLEPKVALEDGNLVIAWYQPSTTTVEGVNSALASLRTSVSGITTTLGTKDDVAGTDTVFGALAGKVDAAGGTMTGVLTLADGSAAASEDVIDTKIANAIGSAGHLKRLVVDALPEASAADADTIYMVKDASVTLGDAYKEYMLIDGAMVQIGDTSVNLEPYATKAMLTAHEEDAVAHITAEERTAWNSKVDSDNETYISLASNAEKLAQLPAIKSIGTGLNLQEDGTLIGAQEYELPVATDTVLGGVKVDNRTAESTVEGVLSVKVVTENGLSVTDNGIAMALASADAAGAMSAEQFTKLANIASGAQVNVVEGAMLGDQAADINESKQIVIPVASGFLGLVKSSEADNSAKVAADGTMEINRVSTTKLYVPDEDELILYGGNALI